ncbi:MAG TPA: GspE/PulE family protein [Candidatus Paceibacterota bacterium]|nr:GspE/PulE family protein [Candidatus Paceibacterota bacterium]
MTGEELLAQLQARQMVTPEVANRVKRDSIVSGDSIEAVLFKERAVPDDAVAKLKSELLSVPYQEFDPKAVDEKLFETIPEETARTYQAVPLSFDGNLLIVGMVHPDDPKAQDALKFIARKGRMNLGVYLIAWGAWDEVMKRYSPYRTEITKAVASLNLKEGSSQKISEIEGDASIDDAPIVKIVADTFREAVSGKASDVHIEPQEHGLRIRFRVSGDLQQVAMLPAELGQPIVSRIKVISSLKIDETRVPQDGRFRAKVLSREIDFRVATLPTPLGEKIVIRVLDPNTGLKNFDSMDMPDETKAVIRAGLEKPFGMVLITGPTGSGKTTTLYSFVRLLNDESVNIVSLEDPVEYFVSGINQSQVKPEIGYTFSSGLRQILRQDPDVIMVGEIRDGETASLAVQAALTGHIVLSTLHTNNSAGVIPRLIDMKVEPFLLPVSVNLMLAQRLVGVLCPDCKVPEDASDAVTEVIRRAMADLPERITSQYPEPYKIYHAQGCATCKGKGIVDRVGIYEVMRMTPELEKIILAGPTTQNIQAEAKRQGMITMRQDGIVKALRGLVSFEEIARETEE